MRKVIILLLLALILVGCKPKESTTSTTNAALPTVPSDCIEATAGTSERYEQNHVYKCGESTIGLTLMLKEEFATAEMDSFLNLTNNYVPKEGETILEKTTKECNGRRYFHMVSKVNETEKSAMFLQEGRLLVTISGNANEIAEEMKLLCK
ncbi:hypothetical protein JXA85_08315 [Candidatus Woesearchaeota archaeon]|nr:hypothetical protein [Candidatus Woesearchaeota archaeon]